MDGNRWTSRELKWRPWENKRKTSRSMKTCADDIKTAVGKQWTQRKIEMSGRNLKRSIFSRRYYGRRKLAYSPMGDSVKITLYSRPAREKVG